MYKKNCWVSVENNAFNLAGRTQKEIESSIQKQVDGVDLDEIYGDDQSKKDAYRKGREQGAKYGLKDGAIEVLEGTANSIIHPIDTITNLGSAIWNYDQTIDAIKISVTQWNELYEYAKVNDPELAGQMVGSLQGKVLGNLGTSIVVSGAAATRWRAWPTSWQNSTLLLTSSFWSRQRWCICMMRLKKCLPIAV